MQSDNSGETTEQCGVHSWERVGVTKDNQMFTVVYGCENCPAWTHKPLGVKQHVPWEETRMYGGSENA